MASQSAYLPVGVVKHLRALYSLFACRSSIDRASKRTVSLFAKVQRTGIGACKVLLNGEQPCMDTTTHEAPHHLYPRLAELYHLPAPREPDLNRPSDATVVVNLGHLQSLENRPTVTGAVFPATVVRIIPNAFCERLRETTRGWHALCCSRLRLRDVLYTIIWILFGGCLGFIGAALAYYNKCSSL